MLPATLRSPLVRSSARAAQQQQQRRVTTGAPAALGRTCVARACARRQFSAAAAEDAAGAAGKQQQTGAGAGAGAGSGSGSTAGARASRPRRTSGDRRRRSKPASSFAETPSKYAQGVFIGVGVGSLVVGGKYGWDTYRWFQDMRESGKVQVVVTYAIIGIKKWLADHPDVREKLGAPPLQFDDQGIGLSVGDGTVVITIPMAGRFARAFSTMELVNEGGLWTVRTMIVDCVDGTRLDLTHHLPQILKTYDSEEYLARWEAHQKQQQMLAEGKDPKEQQGFSLQRINDMLKPSVNTEETDEDDKREARATELQDKGQLLVEDDDWD